MSFRNSVCCIENTYDSFRSITESSIKNADLIAHIERQYDRYPDASLVTVQRSERLCLDNLLKIRLQLGNTGHEHLKKPLFNEVPLLP